MAVDDPVPDGPAKGAPPIQSAAPAIARAALERVLARATELQGSSSEAPDSISEDRLLEVAREVGIDTQHVRQAMAEERARIEVDAPQGGVLLDGLGTAMVGGQRVVPGNALDVQLRLEDWLPRAEGLMMRRRSLQRVSWEPRRDALGTVVRALTSGGRRPNLARVDQVIATVTPVDATRSVVRFDVELTSVRRTQRNLMLAVGVALNGLVFTGIAVPVFFLAYGSPTSAGLLSGLAAVGAAQAGLGYALWRALRSGYRRTVARVQLRVEQLLDDLEQGAVRPAPSLAKVVTNALLGQRR